MLIDKTFFTGDVFIPNLTEACEGLYFYEWIERWEEVCLRTVLGDCLYNEFVNQFEWDEDDEKYVLVDGADEKWGWLLNGHTYVKDDIQNQSLFSYQGCGCGCHEQECDTFYWDGLVNIKTKRIPRTNIDGQTAEGISIKTSLIAYYIYWLWGLKTDTFTASTGEQIADVKNSMRVSNEAQRISAYNKFVSLTVNCTKRGDVGLYRFVQDFSDLFPEWGGKCLDYEPIW